MTIDRIISDRIISFDIVDPIVEEHVPVLLIMRAAVRDDLPDRRSDGAGHATQNATVQVDERSLDETSRRRLVFLSLLFVGSSATKVFAQGASSAAELS